MKRSKIPSVFALVIFGQVGVPDWPVADGTVDGEDESMPAWHSQSEPASKRRPQAAPPYAAFVEARPVVFPRLPAVPLGLGADLSLPRVLVPGPRIWASEWPRLGSAAAPVAKESRAPLKPKAIKRLDITLITSAPVAKADAEASVVPPVAKAPSERVSQGGLLTPLVVRAIPPLAPRPLDFFSAMGNLGEADASAMPMVKRVLRREKLSCERRFLSFLFRP